MKPGDPIGLSVTPDRLTTVRYAGASGDFNPIHLDDNLARSVGLPGRILHGMWTMAQIARAHTEAGGGPRSLKRLEVKFRGFGLPGAEMTVAGAVRSVDGNIAHVRCRVDQDGRVIIRQSKAELRQ